MAEKWQLWMPFHIDRFKGSPAVQAMHPVARIGYLYLLGCQWQSDDCTISSDPIDLADCSGLGDELWNAHSLRILRNFDVMEDGRLRNQVLFDEWQVAQKKFLNGKVERERISEVRRAAGASGGRSKWKSDNTNAKKRSERLAEARLKGTHTDEQWNALLLFCGNACVKCGTSQNIAKDHIVPIYQGGSDAIDNLQPLCRTCNSAKGPDASDLRPNGWQNALQNLPATKQTPTLTGTLTGTETEQKDEKPVGPPKPNPNHTVPDTADTRILCERLCEGVRVFNMREQADMHRLYEAECRAKHEDAEAVMEHMVARWVEYQQIAPKLEWQYGSAYKFFMSGKWDDPRSWPHGKEAKLEAQYEEFLKKGA